MQRRADRAIFFILAVSVISTRHSEGMLEPVQPQIMGGTSAMRGQFPWQVSINITKNSGKKFLCSGTLIHVSWVLTAAHCVKGAAFVEMRVGSTMMNEGGNVLTSSLSVAHHKYNPRTNDNDLALINLAAPVTLSVDVSVIEVTRAEVKPHDSLIVSGWGKTGVPGESFSSALQYAPVKLASKLRCGSFFPAVFRNPDFLCTTGFSIESPCKGDSGSPLVISGPSPLLVGTVSFGTPKCRKHAPTGYIKTKNYRKWIKKVADIDV